MVDKGEKGPDTLRPAQGDDAADLYSSSTVVRDAPSELVELMREAQARDEAAKASKSPPRPGPSTKPPASKAKPVLEGPGRKLDELWDALPSAGDDDDDNDGDGDGQGGSARLHAAEDVTRMLALPEDLTAEIEELDRRELTAAEAGRVAAAQPSIVVQDGVASEVVSSRPRPPPKVESEDEIIETSPRKLLPSAPNRNVSLWVACVVAAGVLLAAAVYLAR